MTGEALSEMIDIGICFIMIHMLTLNKTNTLPLGRHRRVVAAQTPSILSHSRLLTSPIVFILMYILSNVFNGVLLANVALGFKLKRLNRRHVYVAAGSREWDQPTGATI